MATRVGGDLLIRQAWLPGLPTRQDVLIRDGYIDSIAGQVDGAAGPVLDARDQLILPGLIEAHCHLDKTLWGQSWVPHAALPTLAGRIAHERTMRGTFGLPSRANIASLTAAMVGNGTTHIRTHTNVDSGIGLAGIEAVSEVAEAMAEQVSIEQVAFPQSGIIADPGTGQLLEDAARLGVAAIGGLDPAGYDHDVAQHLDVVFGIAERYGCAVDIHLHDGGSLGLWECGLIAERTRALGLQGRVAISHAFALGDASGDALSRTLDKLADCAISVVTSAPPDRVIPSVTQLAAKGVNLACGSDGIRDPWTPFGNGDMLERVMLLALHAGFRRDDEIELALRAATDGGARALTIPDYGLAVGRQADLLIVPARVPAEAVIARPAARTVVKRGRVVASGPAR